MEHVVLQGLSSSSLDLVNTVRPDASSRASTAGVSRRISSNAWSSPVLVKGLAALMFSGSGSQKKGFMSDKGENDG